MAGEIAHPRVVIAGGSGFVGRSLAWHLVGRGFEVTILSRSRPRGEGPWQHHTWDARNLGSWMSALEGAAGLVNFVGRSVDCVKTPDQQDEILRSRVESTLLLGRAVRQVDCPPPVWVQMSTAHIYGDPPVAVCDESSPTGYGFAPWIGRAWEEAFSQAVSAAQRGVVLRTSFVLGRDRGAGAGALRRLVLLARMGLGGRVGSGRQGISWIHEADLNAIVERALTQSAMQGVYIASSPRPVSQSEFMRALRRRVHCPLGLPAPAWMTRFGARYLFRTDPELALFGRYVIPGRLMDEGFEFRFPEIGGALANLLAREDAAKRDPAPRNSTAGRSAARAIGNGRT